MLRRAVLEYATSEPRRQHPPRLHVGVPGGAGVVCPAGGKEQLDQALRADVVAAMVSRVASDPGARDAEDPVVWLVRPGALTEVADADMAWLAAARAAYAEAGRPLTFVVVNRHGWRDPRSGASRTWVRIRGRRR